MHPNANGRKNYHIKQIEAPPYCDRGPTQHHNEVRSELITNASINTFAVITAVVTLADNNFVRSQMRSDTMRFMINQRPSLKDYN